MKSSLVAVGVLIGVPTTLMVLLLIAYFGEFPIPVSSNQFNTDWKFKSLVTRGDQVIGGGYSFAEARDVWIRIRLNHEPDLDSSVAVKTCSPEAREKIRTWFLAQAAAPQKILGILPISGGSPSDETALSDIANLQCKSTEDDIPITHQFGEFPEGCSFSWILYHPPSRFYYERSPCSH
jgi:hypothetical protein